MDLSRPFPEKYVNAEPFCDWPLDFSMGDYSHLSGVAERAQLHMPRELALDGFAWSGPESVLKKKKGVWGGLRG